MLGTDSMSEGLNLQTCARVVNYDLPWNFMRVEQRIGRVDRIGGQPRVEVTNLSYAGTVEDDVLRRIEDRLRWFTSVVGNAQPVLASMESAMQRAALGQITPAHAVNEIEQMNRQAMASPVKLADLDAVPRRPDRLQPAMDLTGLREALLQIPPCAERLSPHPDIEAAWLLHLDSETHPITFDRTQAQQDGALSLLTWANPLLDRLLETAQGGPARRWRRRVPSRPRIWRYSRVPRGMQQYCWHHGLWFGKCVRTEDMDMSTQASQHATLSPRGVLIEWANAQPAWVRYLVGEVLVAAGPAGRDAIDKALAILLAEEGLGSDADVPDAAPLVDTGSVNSHDDPIRLLKLSNVRGVNALVPDQSIEFGRGLTVLYGQNGVGKTGYARIVKRAAGSRGHEDILGNINSASAPAAPSAEFDIEIGDTRHIITWKNEVGIEHLRRIAVFDSATATVHVDDELNYVFTPAELARFDDVNKALQEVQERVSRCADEHALKAQLSPNPFTPGSVVFRSVEEISESTSMDIIRELAEIAPDAEEILQNKRAEVAALGAGAESAQARELERQVNELVEVADVLTALAAFDVDAYNTAILSVDQGRAAVAALRSTLETSTPAGLPLDEHWEGFIRAGADYASHSGLVDYPTRDSACLYCGQHLGDDAHRLIVLYGEFLNSSAQHELDAAVRVLDQTLPPIDEGQLERLLDTPTAFPEPHDLLVRSQKACRDAQGSLMQIANRQRCSDIELFERIHQLIEPLLELRKSVKQELDDLVEQHGRKNDLLPQLQQDIWDLEDTIKLSSHLDAIEECVDEAWTSARLREYGERISSQTRRRLTLAAKRASEDVINRSFEERFEEECTALGARTVSLDFQARRGKVERTKHLGNHRPSAVLSEGEQKMLALADFLAECRTDGQSYPLLFDDPVSSLDERGIEGVTKRLCALAEERQIIVLTHNIMFAATLSEQGQGAALKPVFVEVREQGNDSKGIVGINIEPRLDTPKSLAGKTNRVIQDARAEADPERQDRLISEAYSLMRSWCEVFVEHELFQGVTQRFRAHVRMTTLDKVRVDCLADVIAVIVPKFARISRFVTAHSQAFQQQNTKPTIEELESDWKDLTDMRDRYST